MKTLIATPKFEYKSIITGELKYFADGSLQVKNNKMDKVFTAEEMKEIAKGYLGANRIHKPMALLFWTDCKNGEFNNWTK